LDALSNDARLVDTGWIDLCPQRRIEPTELNLYTTSGRLIRPAHPAWCSLLRRAISDQLSAVSF